MFSLHAVHVSIMFVEVQSPQTPDQHRRHCLQMACKKQR